MYEVHVCCSCLAMVCAMYEGEGLGTRDGDLSRVQSLQDMVFASKTATVFRLLDRRDNDVSFSTRRPRGTREVEASCW
jgi:hypothetical protein